MHTLVGLEICDRLPTKEEGVLHPRPASPATRPVAVD